MKKPHEKLLCLNELFFISYVLLEFYLHSILNFDLDWRLFNYVFSCSMFYVLYMCIFCLQSVSNHKKKSIQYGIFMLDFPVSERRDTEVMLPCLYSAE